MRTQSSSLATAAGAAGLQDTALHKAPQDTSQETYQEADLAAEFGLAALLRRHGLRPTRQRIALANLLFQPGGRHLSAEVLHDDAKQAGIQVSQATIYNTLNQFTEAGLLREVVVDPTRAYFDTTTTPHHHYFFEDSGHLEDVPDGLIPHIPTPPAPEGCKVTQVEVVVRVRRVEER